MSNAMSKDYFILTVTHGRGAYSAAVPYHLAAGETDEWGFPKPLNLTSLCERAKTGTRWRWKRDTPANLKELGAKKLCLDCAWRRVHGGTGPIPLAVKAAATRRANREQAEREKLVQWVKATEK